MAGGRPKQDTEQALSRHVGIRFSAAERYTLEARALEAGLSMSEFVRAAALQTAPKKARRPADAAPVFTLAELGALDVMGIEFRAIGNNLNQIARALNVGTGRAIEDDLRGEIGALAQARQRLDAILARFLQ